MDFNLIFQLFSLALGFQFKQVIYKTTLNRLPEKAEWAYPLSQHYNKTKTRYKLFMVRSCLSIVFTSLLL